MEYNEFPPTTAIQKFITNSKGLINIIVRVPSDFLFKNGRPHKHSVVVQGAKFDLYSAPLRPEHWEVESTALLTFHPPQNQPQVNHLYSILSPLAHSDVTTLQTLYNVLVRGSDRTTSGNVPSELRGNLITHHASPVHRSTTRGHPPTGHGGGRTRRRGPVQVGRPLNFTPTPNISGQILREHPALPFQEPTWTSNNGGNISNVWLHPVGTQHHTRPYPPALPTYHSQVGINPESVSNYDQFPTTPPDRYYAINPLFDYSQNSWMTNSYNNRPYQPNEYQYGASNTHAYAFKPRHFENTISASSGMSFYRPWLGRKPKQRTANSPMRNAMENPQTYMTYRNGPRPYTQNTYWCNESNDVFRDDTGQNYQNGYWNFNCYPNMQSQVPFHACPNSFQIPNNTYTSLDSNPTLHETVTQTTQNDKVSSTNIPEVIPFLANSCEKDNAQNYLKDEKNSWSEVEMPAEGKEKNLESNNQDKNCDINTMDQDSNDSNPLMIDEREQGDDHMAEPSIQNDVASGGKKEFECVSKGENKKCEEGVENKNNGKDQVMTFEMIDLPAEVLEFINKSSLKK